jgi:hypothetical protein
MVRIHDLETNEITDREMTLAEFKKYEIEQAASKAIDDEIAAKAAARQAVLDRLGITADEAAALLG